MVLSAPTNAAVINGSGVVTIGASGGSNVATPYITAPPDTVVGASDGWLDLPVMLSAPSATLVTVAYALPGGNCNNPAQGTSGTLSFTPGVVLKIVRVQVNNCQLATKSFFVLTLSGATSAVIARATTQVDVVGNSNLQATPGLYAKNAVVDNSAGTVQVPVLLGGPKGATLGEHGHGALRDRERLGAVGHRLRRDERDPDLRARPVRGDGGRPDRQAREARRPRRSFSVVLSAPTNAAIINGSGVVTIGASGGSNAATPYIFAPPHTVVGAIDGWLDLSVTLSAPSANLVTVNYAVPGGNCNNPAQGTSGTLSFTPGLVAQVVRVQINDCQLTTKSFFVLTLAGAMNGIVAQATTQVDVVGDSNLRATPGLFGEERGGGEWRGHGPSPSAARRSQRRNVREHRHGALRDCERDGRGGHRLHRDER